MDNAKPLNVTNVEEAKKAVSDLVVFGNGDSWKLLCKASSQSQGWMKSTKAMDVPEMGVLVQVSTQQGGSIAEAITFVPGVGIYEEQDDDGNIIGRRLSKRLLFDVSDEDGRYEVSYDCPIDMTVAELEESIEQLEEEEAEEAYDEQIKTLNALLNETAEKMGRITAYHTSLLTKLADLTGVPLQTRSQEALKRLDQFQAACMSKQQLDDYRG